MDNHICTEECTKIHPVKLDRNEHGDLYIDQKQNSLSGNASIIVERDRVGDFIQEVIELMRYE